MAVTSPERSPSRHDLGGLQKALRRMLMRRTTVSACEARRFGRGFAFRSGRVLRPPATNDTGDSEFPGSPIPFRSGRVLRVQDLKALTPPY